jgi:hypothetical protein
MRGTIVVARDYKGDALLRRVWERSSKLVYLSEESQFQRLSTGRDALTPVGFPIEDVFFCDTEVVKSMENGSLDWSSLQNFDALSRQF